MTYQESLDYINSLLRFGIKPGLERIQKLLDELGNPQDSLRFVHVAGTNGKGTTCTLLASVLKEAGYRTGLYTSPYVTDFRERFQINGEMIPKEAVVRNLEKIRPILETMAERGEIITEFELITALAFLWFAESKCDIVVLEVGLGGRFDATNVIKTPLAAVIASISLDHTAVLGDTVEQIAFEKCGIIKQGGTVVLYPEQQPGVFRVVEEAARERGAELVIADLDQVRETSSDLFGTNLIYHGQNLRLPFIGEHQEKNAASVLTALEVLRQKGLVISAEAVAAGFAAARLPARMEILSERPIVLLDGGHNPGCAAALAKVINKYLSGGKRVAVMGMMSDKDSRTSLSLIAPLFSKIITLRPDNPRSLSGRELADIASEFCPDTAPAKDGTEALRMAKEAAGEDGTIIICGSFFLAGELRPKAIELFGDGNLAQ